MELCFFFISLWWIMKLDHRFSYVPLLSLLSNTIKESCEIDNPIYCSTQKKSKDKKEVAIRTQKRVIKNKKEKKGGEEDGYLVKRRQGPFFYTYTHFDYIHTRFFMCILVWPNDGIIISSCVICVCVWACVKHRNARKGKHETQFACPSYWEKSECCFEKVE